jgi:ribosomal protein S18 acetylase RimI-like enzyme
MIIGGNSSLEEVRSRSRDMPPTTHQPALAFKMRRVQTGDIDAAWKIITEYYEAARVIARDARDDFARIYFRDGAGVWLATIESNVIGCIALRPLQEIGLAGEVKRLYVQPSYRGRGIAASLYQGLETYARECGYKYLYLDTTDEMVAAQRFYAALGYELCPSYNDNPQATIFMWKDLRVSSQ